MIGLTIREMQMGFFDRAEVEAKLSAKMKRVLSRFGAYVMTRDQRSMRYRKGSSAPGSPPNVHRSLRRLKTNKKGVTKEQTVSPLRDFIFFAYDDADEGVLIGPALLNGKKTGVLRIIEEGGTEKLTDKKGRTRTANYKPRPHTRPAFEAEIKTSLPRLLGS